MPPDLTAASEDENARSVEGEHPPMPTVFISYSSRDRDVADSVCSAIEAARVTCWIAPRNITPGTAWGEAIIEGIDGCRLLVLVFSSLSNASKQVMREVSSAADRGTSIIAFRIEDMKPSGTLEYFLGSQHWLDAFTPPLTGHLPYLVTAVQRLLSDSPPGASEVMDTETKVGSGPPTEDWEEVALDDWNRPTGATKGWLSRLFDDR